jgi:hypothetical protein
VEAINFVRSYPAWAQVLFVLCLLAQVCLAIFVPRSKDQTDEAVKHQQSIGQVVPASTAEYLQSVGKNRTAMGYPPSLGVDDLPPYQPGVVLTISAQEIEQFVKSAPPLSRKKVADEAYKGRWVRWNGEIGRITEDENCLCVHVRINGSYARIWFPDEERRLVETLREGTEIHFEAQLWHVEHLCLVRPRLSLSGQKTL